MDYADWGGLLVVSGCALIWAFVVWRCIHSLIVGSGH